MQRRLRHNLRHQHYQDNWISLGEQVLVGIAEPVELFARLCDLDAFEATPIMKKTA